MDFFHDLQKSTQFEDKTIHDFLIRLLDALFGKHDHIIINSDSESEKNQQLIKDQWKSISIYFKVPKTVLKTQKCVRQTLKHIVESLNSQYQFKQPIRFINKKKNVWQNNTCVSICYAEFYLI